MSAELTRGPLVIIGGAEDREGECLVLRSFVRAAGGTKARIAIMTAATGYPEEVGEEYRKNFRAVGGQNQPIPSILSIEKIQKKEASIRMVEQATGIFFTGGDQSRIVDFIKGTSLEAAIHQRHEAGAVIGGTSAGAAMMPDQMIIGGSVSFLTPASARWIWDRGWALCPVLLWISILPNGDASVGC